MVNTLLAGGLVLLLLTACTLSGQAQPGGAGNATGASGSGNAAGAAGTAGGAAAAATLTACMSNCNAVPGNYAEQCTNSCRLAAAEESGDVSYCQALTMPELIGPCYGQVAIAKKDRSVCNQVSGAQQKSECELMYDSS